MSHNVSHLNIKSQYEILPISQKKRGRKKKQDLYETYVPPTIDVTPITDMTPRNDVTPSHINTANYFELRKDVPTNGVLYTERFAELLPKGPNICDDSNNRCTCKAPEVDIPRNGNVSNGKTHNTLGHFNNVDPSFDFILYSDGYMEYDLWYY